ncbi:hypothetical protein [Pyxidicoccus trucidator]|uniref:hypothetical protein n=1 Tax=Pyxidicoccus trucidator TaxID=2709662 RepID=UPI0013DAEFE4|nr:hypothetical protein [Pyxidicoccus trucidator]
MNLSSHNHGGLDVRDAPAVRPDLVVSVTTVGSPDEGADLADYLRRNVAPGGFTEGVLADFANSLGTVPGLLSGDSHPQDALKGLDALTRNGVQPGRGHRDDVNQMLGSTNLFESNPRPVFRSHANRMKNAGL